MRRVCLVGVAIAVLAVVVAPQAFAGPTISLCIGSKSGQGVKSGGEGTGKCPANTSTVTYDKVALPKEESEQQKLLAILPYIKYEEKGIGGKPTIQFAGVNVQIVSGSGQTFGPVNGEGNLVIGYDEEGEGARARTGSHNLIVGAAESYTSYGDILGGEANTGEAPYGAVFGGGNLVSGYASAAFGFRNTASGASSTVTGGEFNTASDISASVSGGVNNKATGQASSVSGGNENTAEGTHGAWVGGGWHNESLGSSTAVAGGDNNKAEGSNAAVFGGTQGLAEGGSSLVLGGLLNEAKATRSSVLGGAVNVASFERATAVGGIRNKATNLDALAAGGGENRAEGQYSGVFGGLREVITANGGHN